MTPDEFTRECRETARRVRRLPATVRAALRARVRSEVAEPIAADVRAGAGSVYGRRVAPTARVRAGADPTIAVGSARRVTSGGASARDLVFGIHFAAGSKVKAVPKTDRRRGHRRRTTRQFVGRRDPFVFRTLARNADRHLERWSEVVADIIGKDLEP